MQEPCIGVSNLGENFNLGGVGWELCLFKFIINLQKKHYGFQ